MSENDEKKTFGERLFDNIFFWLAVGVGLPMIFYFAWGIIEVLTLGKMPDYSGGL